MEGFDCLTSDLLFLGTDLARCSWKIACGPARRSVGFEIGISNLPNGFLALGFIGLIRNSLEGRYLCWFLYQRKVHSATIAVYSMLRPSDNSTGDYVPHSTVVE